jgi:hypothetical protein
MNYSKYINENHPRFNAYAKGRKLFLGEHYDAFNINQFEYFNNRKDEYISCNYAQVITNVFCDLTWSEPPGINLKDNESQEVIQKWIRQKSVLTTARECSETASYGADAAVRLRMNGDEVELEQIDNNIWFPIFDSNNPKKATGHIIKYTKKNDKREFWLLEIHNEGKVEWEAFEIDAKKDPKPIAVLPTFKEEMQGVKAEVNNNKVFVTTTTGGLYLRTKCDLPLVFHLKNTSLSNQYYGVSDYSPSIIAKIYAINQNLNQIQHVLRKHADPKMVLPESIIRQACNEVIADTEAAKKTGFASKESALAVRDSLGKSVFENIVAERILNKAQFIPSNIQGGEAKYLTWDGNLNESREQNKNLKQMINEESQISKILIDPESNIGSASGVAIMRMAQPTLHKVAKKQTYIEDWMSKIVYTALQLMGKEPEYPNIKFQNGLVNDEREVVELNIAKKDSGFITDVDAIMSIESITKDEAQTKVDEIKAQNDIYGGDNPNEIIKE